MEGINLLDSAAVSQREVIFAENYLHDMVHMDRPADSLRARSCISRDWKLTVWQHPQPDVAVPSWQTPAPKDEVQLFHLKVDPLEKNNVAREHPEQVAAMTRQLTAWWDPARHDHRGGRSEEPFTKNLTYKTVGATRLEMKLWYPPTWQEGGKRLPAVVFFFGGGWHGGGIGQFNTIAPYLARRGMIVVTPQYRTIGQHGVAPSQCLEDAKSAMRYVYQHAGALGIDERKIAGGGRSAGGHLAAATAFSQGFDAPGEDLAIRCKPAALVLFNPVIDNGPGGFGHHLVQDYWKDFSPLHNISMSVQPPPTLFLLGDRDKFIPVETGKKYQAAMQKQGGRCDLLIYENAPHGFFAQPKYYHKTMQAVEDFLASLGYLKSGQDRTQP